MSRIVVRAGLIVGLVTGLAFSASALASPIEFVFTGTGSGTIGNTSFTDAAFTITQFSDTSGLGSCPISGPDCLYINATTADINIAGVGEFSLTSGTRAYDNFGEVGFSRAGADGWDLYDAFPVPAGYDLTTANGPDYGEGCLLQWTGGIFTPVTTSDGTLIFNSSCSSGYFQAIVGSSPPPSAVPEPTTLALFGLGLAGIGFMRRRRAG